MYFQRKELKMKIKSDLKEMISYEYFEYSYLNKKALYGALFLGIIALLAIFAAFIEYYDIAIRIEGLDD